MSERIFSLVVDGGFSQWSDYGICSEECGEGNHERTRTCTNPEPAHGGKDCQGSQIEIKVCKIKECPGNASQNSLIKNNLFLIILPFIILFYIYKIYIFLDKFLAKLIFIFS